MSAAQGNTLTNGTLIQNTTTLATTSTEWTPPDIDVTPSYVLKAIGLTAVVIVTSFGNLIVLVAFVVDSKLWQPFNLYIMNLAVTDFLVGVSAMTFNSIDILMGYWPFGQVRTFLYHFELIFEQMNRVPSYRKYPFFKK